jgi:hypothetical protein
MRKIGEALRIQSRSLSRREISLSVATTLGPPKGWFSQ